jgi:hypothetical protein
VDVRSDTVGMRLAITPPRGAVWMGRVTPVRPTEPAYPLPTPPSETLAVEFPPPPALEVDDELKPPLPRTRATLEVPRGAGRGWVELDVRVDEAGEVSDALWAAGSTDSAHVRAAIACALAMRFYPAQLAGRAIAVWCRQRFDFGG